MSDVASSASSAAPLWVKINFNETINHASAAGRSEKLTVQ